MEINLPNPALFSPRELAQRSGWPERRIRNLIQQKKMKHLKIGASYFLPEDAIEEYVSRNMIEPSDNAVKG